jgi:hypothetical protein
MPTHHVPLNQVDGARIAGLVANAVREGRQLEYKEQLPGGSDDDKREFLADLTSFANTVGGDLIYGVRERRDANGGPTGEPDMIVGLPGLNVGAQQLRLENLAQDGVEPRLPPLSFHEVRRDPDPPCLLLRVPRSWAGLHMVTFKNLSRIFGRNSAGKYQLDIGQIRAEFRARESEYERVRRFRAERIGRVVAGETPIPIGHGPKVIFHGLPVTTGDGPWSRLMSTEETQISDLLPPLGGSASSWRFNLDGFVTYTIRPDPDRDGYAQIFRDGGIEKLSGGLIGLTRREGSPPRDFFYGFHVEEAAINAFASNQRCWTHIGVEPPVIVGLCLTGIMGVQLRSSPDSFRNEPVAFDRDPLVIPEIVVEDLSRPAHEILRPLFNLLWNAGGWASSPYYNAAGQWKRPR